MVVVEIAVSIEGIFLASSSVSNFGILLVIPEVNHVRGIVINALLVAVTVTEGNVSIHLKEVIVTVIIEVKEEIKVVQIVNHPVRINNDHVQVPEPVDVLFVIVHKLEVAEPVVVVVDTVGAYDVLLLFGVSISDAPDLTVIPNFI